MVLMDEILGWSQTLSPWKQDALRRLLIRDGVLEPGDYDELFSMMLAAHGLGDGNEPEPQPLAAEHIPVNPAQAPHVEVLALRKLKNVNRLAGGQTLSFEPAGITVIYGANGSGKSGYARVMKKACRAREDSEKIHTDLTDAAARAAVPSALFDLQENGNSKQIPWQMNRASPEELATISVFDSSCARIYLKPNQDVAYLPYGLDIVKNFGDVVLPELRQRVDRELAALNTSSADFEHLKGGTEIGRVLTGLSHLTDEKTLEPFADFSPEDEQELEALIKTLAEDSPKDKADELTGSYQRLKALANEVSEQGKHLTANSIKVIRVILDNLDTAEKAVEAASKLLHTDEEPLKGTGGREWKVLFEAAQKFAQAADYAENDDLPSKTGEKCVLCQQPLSDDGANRLSKFKAFVANEASTTLREQTAKYDKLIERVSARKVGFDPTKTLRGELERLNAQLANDTFDLETQLRERTDALLASIKSRNYAGIDEFDVSDIRGRLRQRAAAQLKAARRYSRAFDPKKRAELEQQKSELNAKKQFATLAHAVTTCLINMKRKNLLTKCNAALDTRTISNKTKELSEVHVNDELFTALKSEFRRLKVREVRVVLDTRVRRGIPQQTLSLDFNGSGRQEKLEEVLSEGEQRAIALSSFFAELQLANHRGGICFDDPVSSLDHQRRHLVAKRQVEEAQNRQVIVFTHDASFLGQLRDQIKRTGVKHKIHHLEWDNQRPGNVRNGLPWDQQKVSQRVDRLEQLQRKMNREWGAAQPNDEQVQEMRSCYSKLRATVERAVQDEVLAGTVQRFSDYIQPKMLDKVIKGFTAAENTRIQELYQRCNDVVDAHDASADGQKQVPTPDEFKDDIDELKAIIAAIGANQKH
ncbi:AAA family ATPase [Sedimenticola hydrogenitrophicus]|uniref:AAA family ATPase n=1 Tax=Sedimenticola hydrogenitrophicus TaxID=2967975 RepID=UPI0023AF886B|nr:AAA family ATPase [Sedimenticola hydrogenitrophicus]